MSAKFDGIRLNGQRRGVIKVTENTLTWDSQKGHVETINFSKTPIKKGVWTPIGQKFELRLLFEDTNKPPVRFSNFSEDDEPRLKRYLTEVLGKRFKKQNVNVSGQNWGLFKIKDKAIQVTTENGQENLLTIPLRYAQKTTQNGEHELSIDLAPPPGCGGVQLGEIRLFIPDPADQDPTQPKAYQLFEQAVKKHAKIEIEEDEVVTTFNHLGMRTPRGQFKVDFFPNQLRIKNDRFNTLILYDTIKKCFVLDQSNGKQAVCVQLSPPFRHGQTSYDFLLFEYNKHLERTQIINATDEELKNEYADRNGKQILDHEVNASVIEILVALFSCLAKARTISHNNDKSFKSNTFSFEHTDEPLPCLRCSYKANTGYIYPLSRSFFFIHKPPMCIRYADTQWIRFEKVGKSTIQKSFDLVIRTNEGQEYKFMNFDLKEFHEFFKFCLGKEKLRILDKQRLMRIIQDDVELEGKVRKSVRIRNDVHLSTVNLIDDHEDDGDGSTDDDFDVNAVEEQQQEILDEDAEEEYDSNELAAPVPAKALNAGSDDDGAIKMKRKREGASSPRKRQRT